jgi:hypothetical protein
MTTPVPPSARDDDRDPQVAAWLAVDPLDSVTRARLVRAALAEVAADRIGSPARARRQRLVTLVAIAAVLVGLLVVAGALLGPGSDDSSPTAIDAPATRATPEASRESGDAAAPSSATGAPDQAPVLAPLPSIGDLGDVSTEERLERAARAALAVPPGSGVVSLDGCALSAAEAFGTPVRVGTGRMRGQPATVVVAQQPSGSTAIVAVRGTSCRRAVSVILP